MPPNAVNKQVMRVRFFLDYTHLLIQLPRAACMNQRAFHYIGRRVVGSGEGELETEGGALAGGGLDFDLSAVDLGDVFDD